jgi:HK97 family phage major capsid protein
MRFRFGTIMFDPEPEPGGGGGGTATLEAVAKSVHDLAEAVEEMKAGKVDEETVRRISEEVLAKSKQTPGRRSFVPDDVDDTAVARILGQGEQRLTEIHRRNPKAVAQVIHRDEAEVRDFQVAGDRLLLMSAILAAQKGQHVDPRELNFYDEQYRPMLQAMDSTTTAEGKEFVPTELSSTLIDRVNLELQVASLFSVITMPTNPFDIPGRPVARTRLGKHAEQTADTGQTLIKKVTPGTRKVTLSAVKFAGESLVSKELEEDGLIAILPFIEEELVDYLTADVEDTTVNGDDSGTHQDSDVTAADDPRKNWKGLRKLLLTAAKTDAANAVLTSAMLRTSRLKMGVYGVRAANLAHIVGMANYIHLLGDANVLTVDKYGANAVILQGELGKVDGIPIIVSEYIRQNLNASGVYDGVTTDRSVALTVNKRAWAYGTRRDVTLQILTELYAEADQDAIKVTHRRAFSALYPTATEPIVAAHYNTKTT